MDRFSLKKLEYDRIQEMLVGLTLFPGGRNRALKMNPVTDKETVNRRLDETAEAMEALRFGEPGYLSGLKLLDRQLEKARVQGVLHPEELRDVCRLLNASRLARRNLNSERYRRLQLLVLSMEEIPLLEKRIDEAISEEGSIRDDATVQLKTIRNQINTSKTRIKDYLNSFIRSGNNQKMLQDAIITERDGRYVVPVKQEYRHEVKGIVHDESASGATVFIEPMPVVQQNNRIRELQAEEKREMERILRELSLAVAEYTTELAHNQEILSLLDYIFARGRLAYKMNAFRPEINEQGMVQIYRGKHPLLGEEAVPVNIELGRQYHVLVITGPNTGGKTVTLKMVGLLTLMAMSGLFIPAREKSRIAIFTSVFVDIGDEQSIEQSLSTFSGHMSNIIGIIQAADERSLVLIDELGAGTDPVEGAALARVILEELCRRHSRVIVTTHQSELKSFAYQHQRVENACVEFDPATLKPTYELTIGMPGQSNAFEIAGRLGLDEKLVKRARTLVPEREQEIGNMIRELKESHYHLETESRQVSRLKEMLQQEREQLHQEREQFHQEREEILEKSRSEADKYVRQVKQEASHAIQELKDHLKNKDKPPRWHEIEDQRKKLQSLRVEPVVSELANAEVQDVKAGDYVMVKTVKQKGYVISPPNENDELTVQVGMMKLNVKRNNVKKLTAPEEKITRIKNQSFLDKAHQISKEIDVRGKLSEEAIIEIDRYLEDAHLVGLDSVRIIHGKGTGALRAAVREYLRDHRYIKAFRDGLREEGGHGVTVAEMK